MSEDQQHTAGAKPQRRNLGRGLRALLGEDAVLAAPGTPEGGKPASGVASLPVAVLRPSPFQPRRSFEPEAIESLAESIRERGVLQPLLVRPIADEPGQYEIVAGERRWRAAQRAQVHEVPAVVREMDDREVLEVALVENLQRQDLNALEEAEGYRRLQEEFQHTQEDLARVVGKSRSHIANTLRLLTLPDEVKSLVEKGEISAGHARALIGSPDPLALAREIVARGLNVRQTERLARAKPAAARKGPPAKDTDTQALERDLTSFLGLRVSIEPAGKGGRLVLHYQTLEQLDDLLQRLGRT